MFATAEERRADAVAGLAAMRECEHRVCDERRGPTRPLLMITGSVVRSTIESVVLGHRANARQPPQLQYRIESSSPA
eukprot:8813595-Lingulodinium_polyedra.AAC.1